MSSISVVRVGEDKSRDDKDRVSQPARKNLREGHYCNGRLKRAFDLIGVVILMPILAPLMVIIALIIKIDSPGPIFFRQVRQGRGLNSFRVWKFRTMVHDEQPFAQAVERDERVTRAGRFLRRSSLDELPQVFNVIVGEMSLVGPRPHPLELDAQYSSKLHRINRRYESRPGITGLAQISGHRGPTPTVKAMSKRLSRDLAYVRHASLLLEFRILAITLREIVWSRNAF